MSDRREKNEDRYIKEKGNFSTISCDDDFHESSGFEKEFFFFKKKRLVYQGNSVSNQKYSVAPNSISVFSADEYHRIRKQDAVTMIYHQRNVQYLLQNVGEKTFHT